MGFESTVLIAAAAARCLFKVLAFSLTKIILDWGGRTQKIIGLDFDQQTRDFTSDIIFLGVLRFGIG